MDGRPARPDPTRRRFESASRFLVREALSIGLLTAGVAPMVVDIVTAPRSARAHNEAVRRMSIGPASVGGAPGIRVGLGL